MTNSIVLCFIQYSKVFRVGLNFYFTSFRDHSLDLSMCSDLVIESRAYIIFFILRATHLHSVVTDLLKT